MNRLPNPQISLKTWGIALLCWSLPCVSLLAQTDSLSVSDGIRAFEAQDYDQSIVILTTLIGDSLVPAQELPQAHYFLGQSYWMVGQNPDLKGQFPRAIPRAHSHLATARVIDRTSPLSEFASESLQLLWPYLYNLGVEAYNQQQYQAAWQYFYQVKQIDEENYRNTLSLSFASWQKGDTTGAVKIWQDLRQTYQAAPLGVAPAPEVVQSVQFLQSYYSLIGNPETDLALAAPKSATPAQGPIPAAWRIPKSELRVYQAYELNDREAQDLFEWNLRRFPEDKDLKMAYGSWLYERDRQDTALVLFGNVISLDSNYAEAYLRLAAHHLNTAIDLSQADLPTPEAIQQLESAYPFLQHLHTLQPSNIAVLNRLVQIASYLDLPEASRYHTTLAEMKSGNLDR